MSAPVAHPALAETKFTTEVQNFQRDGHVFRRRGAFLLDVTSPVVTLGFAAPQLNPPGLLFAIKVDYTDYDLIPPSVRFVHPFDDHDLTAAELPYKFLRRENQTLSPEAARAAGIAAPVGAPVGPDGTPMAITMETVTPLVQDYGPETKPFLCLAGIREYHDHPGHSGDSWELHRAAGAGALTRIVNLALTYGVEPVGGWAIDLSPRVSFGYGQPPL